MEGTGVQEKQCIKNNSSADEITALLDDFYPNFLWQSELIIIKEAV
jgi:hypothetical protein